MIKHVFHRLLGLALSLLLVISLLPQQAHAASASLSASSSYLRAGNSFTLYLSVSGSDVAGIEASLTYDSSALTYNGYSNYIGGSWVLSESSRYFTMYNSSGDTFSGSTRLISLSFTVKSSASPGASLSVSVNGTASEGGSDRSFSAYWSDEVLPPLSGNANLDDLWCYNADLNFTGSTEYSITVPYEVSSLDLDWDRAHSGSYVSVSGNSLSVGSNTVTVTVEAENGNTKRYYIYVTREQDPNYVPSSDATLSSVTPSSGTLSPAFAPDVTDYVLYVPYEITALNMNATANDGKAKGVSLVRQVLIPIPEVPADETVPSADGNTAADPKPVEPQFRVLAADEPLPEGETLYILTCTAEDGVTTMDYTVHVIRMPLYAGMLPEIIPPVTEPVEPEPEPEPTTFDISLPLVMTLPYIGEVTLQQAAMGAAIALGVILLVLLLIVWLIGRAGGRRKALRKLAKAAAQPSTPKENLLDRLAADDAAAAATAAAVVSVIVAENTSAAEDAAPEEDTASEEDTVPEEIPTEMIAAAEDVPTADSDTENAAPAEAVAEEEPVLAEDSPTEEEIPSEEDAATEEDIAEEARPAFAVIQTAVADPAEEESAAQEADGESAYSEDTPSVNADENAAVEAMSLDDLLEDIRNM